MSRVIAAKIAVAMVVAACTSTEGTVTLVTHDSFVLPDEVIAGFEADEGVSLEVVQVGDAGTTVANAIATAGDPLGDVLFGVDNLLVGRALQAGLFEPYAADGLEAIPERFRVDDQNRVTPIDFGYVCVNYRPDAMDGEAPETLDDLRRPRFASQFVTQNPESSSPGLVFLAATVARYGEPGWQDFWRDLRDNGVTITSGWSESYENFYVGGTPDGTKAIVNSYASSPVFEGLFGGEDPVVSSILLDSCFEQIEFAGILAGTDNRQAAERLLDWLISPAVQSEIPLAMFVSPVNPEAVIPDDFARFTPAVEQPLSLPPAVVAAGRDRWTAEWLEIFRE